MGLNEVPHLKISRWTKKNTHIKTEKQNLNKVSSYIIVPMKGHILLYSEMITELQKYLDTTANLKYS